MRNVEAALRLSNNHLISLDEVGTLQKQKTLTPWQGYDQPRISGDKTKRTDKIQQGLCLVSDKPAPLFPLSYPLTPDIVMHFFYRKCNLAINGTLIIFFAFLRVTAAANLTVPSLIECLPVAPNILRPRPSDCYTALWMMTQDPYFTIPRIYADIHHNPSSVSRDPMIERRTPLTWIRSSCKIVIESADPNTVDEWEVKAGWRRAWEVYTRCVDPVHGSKGYVGGIAPVGKQGFEVYLRGRNLGDSPAS